MTDDHERKPRGRVSEAMPVQVFLGHQDHARLQRLTEQLDITKSEVLRRSLAALERQVLDPDVHPALRLIGLVGGDDGSDTAGDVALDHDRVLAASHEPSRGARGRKPRGKS